MPITEAELKAYAEVSKAKGPRLLSGDLFKRIQKDFDSKDEGLKDLFEAVEGDYTKFSKLPAMYRDFWMTYEMKSFTEEIHRLENRDKKDLRARTKKEAEAEREAEIRAYIADKALNPVFQTGLEVLRAEMIGKNVDQQFIRTDGIDVNRIGEASAYATTKVMQNTLEPISAADFSEIFGSFGAREVKDAAISKNIDKQVAMATLLYVAHHGNVSISDAKGDPHPAGNFTMGEIFGHGGRTSFNLPKTLGSVTGKDFVNIILGGAFDNGAIYGRSFATHNMSPKNVKVLGTDRIKKQYREGKPFITSGLKNYGMDPAIGGFGKKFGKLACTYEGDTISPPLIKDDGKNGHMYIKMREPSHTEEGYLLVGFENEAPGENGRFGHSHGPSASKSEVSAFGATKHGVGATMGGRNVDLTERDITAVYSNARKFAAEYRDKLTRFSKMQKNDPEFDATKDEIDLIASMLSGPKMSAREMVDLEQNMGIGLEEEIYKNLYEEDPKSTLDLLEASSKRINEACQAETENKLVNPKFLFLNDALKQNNRKFLFFKVNSDEMKDVKKALKAVLDADNHGDRDKYMKDVETLNEACAKYIADPGKADNKRRGIVSELALISAQTLQPSLREKTSFDEIRKDEEGVKHHKQQSKDFTPKTIEAEKDNFYL